MSSRTKDPQGHLDYLFDWRRWLSPNEQIISHTITPTGGVAVSSSAVIENGGTVVAWVRDGVVPADAAISCFIETNQNRTDARKLTLAIRIRF